MDGFIARLGFLIRILVLIFTWAAVALFISPELAAGMGALVILLWLFFFLPKSLVDEFLWQKKASATLKAAMAQAPLYQAGTALPAPENTAGQIIDVPPPATAGSTVEAWRDLPALQFDPRHHAGRFKRSFALPVVGLFMIICATNDTVVRHAMDTLGIKRDEPIEWAQLKLPDTLLDKQEEMQAAARLALRREPYCGRITAGSIEPVKPFLVEAAAIKAEIEAGRYRYVFDCTGTARDTLGKRSLSIWAGPDDLKRSQFKNLFLVLSSPPAEEVAMPACRAATRTALTALGATIGDMLVEAPTYYPGSLPYPDHARLISVETLYRGAQMFGRMEVNCYVGPTGGVEIRFTRPQVVPDIVITQ